MSEGQNEGKNIELYAQVENFISELLNGDIEIKYSKAKDLMIYHKEKGFLGKETRKNESPLSNALGHALTDYQAYKADPQLRTPLAGKCLQYIIWAYTHQVIKRIGLAKKIAEVQKENAQLKEEKDKFQKEILRLNQLNEALHQTIDRLGYRRIATGNDEEGKGR